MAAISVGNADKAGCPGGADRGVGWPGWGGMGVRLVVRVSGGD